MDRQPSAHLLGDQPDSAAPGYAEVESADARDSRQVRRVRGLANLAVRIGANVQPGQIVSIGYEPENAPMAHTVAEVAYGQGALFVDPCQFDVRFKRARALYADPETLGYIPPWLGQRLLSLGEHRGATIQLAGPGSPHAMDGIDPALIARDLLPRLPEAATLSRGRVLNWTIVPCPTPAWAELVHPDLESGDALARLWDEISYVCRLAESDPVQAWTARMDELDGIAERLDRLGLDAVRFDGPGTALTVGLLRSSRWTSARMTNADGIVQIVNIPSEEVFTTPDPTRVDGFVHATKPLFTSGVVVRELEVTFERGKVTGVAAESGADIFRALVATDAGAAHLGEVALVDRRGRIGPLGTVFFATLLDENAASHIAIGDGIVGAVGDPQDHPRINKSVLHIDFMIGGNDVSVTGLLSDGREVPLLVDGDWMLR